MVGAGYSSNALPSAQQPTAAQRSRDAFSGTALVLQMPLDLQQVRIHLFHYAATGLSKGKAKRQARHKESRWRVAWPQAGFLRTSSTSRYAAAVYSMPEICCASLHFLCAWFASVGFASCQVSPTAYRSIISILKLPVAICLSTEGEICGRQQPVPIPCSRQNLGLDVQMSHGRCTYLHLILQGQALMAINLGSMYPCAECRSCLPQISNHNLE